MKAEKYKKIIFLLFRRKKINLLDNSSLDPTKNKGRKKRAFVIERLSHFENMLFFYIYLHANSIHIMIEIKSCNSSDLLYQNHILQIHRFASEYIHIH